jgi:hypothetical protein
MAPSDFERTPKSDAGLRADLNRRFDAMDSGFDSLDRRLDGIGDSMDVLGPEAAAISNRAGNLDRDNAARASRIEKELHAER